MASDVILPLQVVSSAMILIFSRSLISAVAARYEVNLKNYIFGLTGDDCLFRIATEPFGPVGFQRTEADRELNTFEV